MGCREPQERHNMMGCRELQLCGGQSTADLGIGDCSPRRIDDLSWAVRDDGETPYRL